MREEGFIFALPPMARLNAWLRLSMSELCHSSVYISGSVRSKVKPFHMAGEGRVLVVIYAGFAVEWGLGGRNLEGIGQIVWRALKGHCHEQLCKAWIKGEMGEG